MPRFDIEKPASPNAEARAIADYGEQLDDLRYDYIAMQVAQGEPISKAYGKAFPDAAPTTAKSQASVLCAHPEMRRKIADHQITARNLITAALPRSVRKTVDLLNAESEQTQLKAASSIQDRAGLPPQSELAVHATITAEALYQDALQDAEVIEVDAIPPASPAETIEEPSEALSGAPLGEPLGEPSPHSPLETLEHQKAAWKAQEPS